MGYFLEVSILILLVKHSAC